METIVLALSHLRGGLDMLYVLCLDGATVIAMSLSPPVVVPSPPERETSDESCDYSVPAVPGPPEHGTLGVSRNKQMIMRASHASLFTKLFVRMSAI